MAVTAKSPPGPRGHVILGALPEFRRDAVQAVMDAKHMLTLLSRLKAKAAQRSFMRRPHLES